MRLNLLVFFLGAFFVVNAQDTVKVNMNLTPEEQAQQHYNDGITALNKGQGLVAADLFSKSILLKPDFEKAYYNRCIANTMIRHYPDALADINKVLSGNPNNIDARFAKAMVFFGQGQKDSTNRWLDNTLGVGKHAEAYYYKGIIMYQVGDYDEAIKDYSGAIEIKADYAYAYNDRASAKRAKNDLTGAIADYEKALSLNPEFVFIYNNLGSVYRLSKNYDKAIEYYTKAMNAKPEYLLALNNRGAAKLEAGKLEDAKKDFEDVLKKDPKNSSAFNNLASLALKQKDYKKAKDMAAKAIELNANNGAAYFNRGIARQMLHDEEGSCGDWKKAADLGVSAAKTFMNTDCN
jgi:tetratricopeptide (TPR) repeat protein